MDSKIDARGVATIAVVLAALLCIFSILMIGTVGRIIDVGCIGACLDRQDLSMQANMALAAWTMALVTTVSLGVGAVSLYFLRANLIETRRIGEAQVRAYLIVTGTHAKIDQLGRLRVVYEFRNSGETPATKVSCETQVFVDHLAGNDLNWDRVAESRAILSVRSDIPSQADRKGNTGALEIIKFTPNLEDRLLWGKSYRLVVKFTLKWSDVFGRQHVAPVHYGGYQQKELPKLGFISIELRRQLRDDGRMDFDVFD